MYCLLDDDLWKIETCRRWNILIIKLHIDIVNLVGFNEMVIFIIIITSSTFYVVKLIFINFAWIP
jgi:hypothetical protein